LPANVRLGWKGLTLANTLAYYGALKITTIKEFFSTYTWSQSHLWF